MALTHFVNHWIRVEALAIFHEGEFSAGEIAKMIGEDVKVVRDHVQDLYHSGCVEFAGFKLVDGATRRTYRAITQAIIGVETYRSMSLEDRHNVNGAVVQGLHAEVVSAYRNGKFDADEDSCLVWEPLHLDAEAKRELLEHLIAAWKGAKEIEARSINRIAESGEEGTSSVAAFIGFERGQIGRPEGGYHSQKNVSSN